MDGVKWMSPVVVFLLAVCSLVKQGMTISCIMCNSARNVGICESLKGNVESLKQDCDELPEAVQDHVNYTVCRKIYQQIYNHGDTEIERIVRQCGTSGKLGCERRTRPNSLLTLTCHCNHDLCNAAVKNASSSVFISVLVALLAWCNTAFSHW